MIENLQIIAGGEDIAAEQQAMLQGPTLANIIGKRIGQIAKGHTAAADDQVSYAEMLRNAEAWYLRPMRERTHGRATAAELRGAANAADNLAALCWAVADKARRHASAIDVAEQSQQEERK